MFQKDSPHLVSTLDGAKVLDLLYVNAQARSQTVKHVMEKNASQASTLLFFDLVQTQAEEE